MSTEAASEKKDYKTRRGNSRLVHHLKPVSTLITREDDARSPQNEIIPEASKLTPREVRRIYHLGTVPTEITARDLEKIRGRRKVNTSSSGVTENLPAAPADLSALAPTPQSFPSLSHRDEISHSRYALLEALRQEISKNPGLKKRKLINEFVKGVKSKVILPDLYQDLKKISRPTVYRWIRAYKEGGIKALTPQKRGPEATVILPDEKDVLLNYLLDQNQPTISDGIRECKKKLREDSTSHPAKLRRFVDDYIEHNRDVWIKEREGRTAWNNKVAPYQDRDPMLLEFGEALVADGRRCDLNVFNPISGKLKRPTIVVFLDWRSTFPVGLEVSFSENAQSISTALFNALMKIGKLPEVIYTDNGKAFVSKFFTRKSITIGGTKISGMIEQLNELSPEGHKIQYRQAPKYHPQSKITERWWRILGDRLERRFPSYVGSSIKNKPAYLLQNEAEAKARHDDRVPTIPQFTEVIYQWIEEYIDEPRPKRQDLTPRQMFEEGKGPGFDPTKLFYLMMVSESKKVSRCRFTFAREDWEGPCLYGFEGEVIIRYSLGDFSKIYVFDPSDGRYMGEVTQTTGAHPTKNYEAARKIENTRQSYSRLTNKRIDLIRENPFLIDGRQPTDLPEYIEAEDAKKTKRLPYKLYPDKPETSDPGIQNEPETTVVDPETGFSCWANRALPPSFSRRYDDYCEMVRKGFNLTAADYKWIEDYERSDEWRMYYPGKDSILMISQPRGEEDEGKICVHEIR